MSAVEIEQLSSSPPAGRVSSLSGVAHRLTTITSPWFDVPEPTSFKGGWRVALITGMIVVGTGLALLKTPLSQWNILWAEDGSIFLSQQLSGDQRWALFEPYAGYMHLIPRLAIFICSLFPIQIVPLVVTIVSAFLISATAVACFVFMETRIRSFPLRLLSWAVLIVTPVAGAEVANNLANLHWFLMTAAVCALIVRSRGTGFTVLQCVVVIAAVGSDPLTLLFLPLLIIRWLALPARRDRALAFAFAAAAAMQLSVTAVSYLSGAGRSFAGAPPTVAELVDHYVYRVVMSGLIGPSAVVGASEWFGLSLPGIVVTLVFVAMIAISWSNRSTRYAVLALSGSSIAFFAIVFRLQWDVLHAGGVLGFEIGQRYTVLSTMLLLMALLVAIDGYIRERAWPVRLVAIVGIALVVIVPSVRDYRWNTLRADTTSWHTTLEEAVRQCEAGATSVSADIAPPGFYASVPCNRLADIEGW